MLNATFVIIGILMLGALSACATHPPKPEQPAALSPATAPAYDKPTWVAAPSAPLPEGYPPPGPVGEVVVKTYPACRAAQVRNPATDADGMFMPLFRHIQKNKIEMTAPVAIGYDPAASRAQSMAFVYPLASEGNPGSDGPVQVLDVPPLTVASLGFRGSYNDAQFAKTYAKLQEWLAAHAGEYQPVGPPRMLGYNSPFVLPFFRFGEVQVPIEPVKK